MKVLIAGSRGAIGRMLVDKLVAEGHQVAGMVRTEEQRAEVEPAGARGMLADLTGYRALAEAA